MKWVEAGLTAVLFIVGFLVLAVRLASVQITDSAQYRYDNARQSVRRIQTGGPRGRILDRHGVPLADNRPSVSIACLPAHFQQRTWAGTTSEISNAIERVGRLIGRESKLAERTIRRHVRQSLALPLVVWHDISERELAVFAEHSTEYPGFEIEESIERVYPQGALAAHILGYVGRDRGDALAGDEKFNFFAPEMRGRAGLEIYYDSFLRGVSGERKVLVDARGFAIEEWTVVEARKGPDLKLSIDARIQAAVEKQLEGEKGACAVIDPQTGEVLALASAPGFNPNDFVPTLNPALYEQLSKDPAKPLLNRVSGGAYAPGSTFKPITALAGLSVGFPPRVAHECVGVYGLHNLKLHCSARWGHGALDMRHALMKSCNPYFCNLAIDIGTNALIRAAKTFGLGEKTGLDLGVDMAGTVPDAEWKMAMYHEKWFLGDLAQMSIGQGMLLVSPLQMARVAGAIGTGYLVTPHLKRDLPVEKKELPYAPMDLKVVRDGMRMVVNGDGDSRGTGWRAGEGLSVVACGKTGTAEIGKGETRRKNTWFIAYAPEKNPTVAIAMVIENGESGGGTTAPKVGAVLREIFN